MSDLSVLIPARNERWLSRTVQDVCAHMRGDTDVWVVLDGAWPEPGYELVQHPRVHVVYLPQSIGQRAATNLAAKLSSGRYLMKLDAHCSVADGFDVELVRAGDILGHDVTQIPSQRNLHIYDRVCPCGKREYQGPLTQPCVACGKTEWTLDIQCGGATLATTCHVAIGEGACSFVEPSRSARGTACPRVELK